MGKIKIGTITKPQALKGAFRVKPDILAIKKLKKLSEVTIDNKDYMVESVTIRDTFVIFKVQGIDSCEDAENLRNKSIYGDVDIDTSNIFDLVGFDAKVGDTYGKIVDINNFGSKDLLTIEFDKSCMLPVIDGLIEKIDNDNRVVVLNEEIFNQVAVYENWYFNTFSGNVWWIKIKHYRKGIG